MKTKELIFIVKKSLEGGYEASALGESIFTEAESVDELKFNIVEAVRCHFDENSEKIKLVYQTNQKNIYLS